MNTFARKHYGKKAEILNMKILDAEFLKYQLQSIREGFRMQYDQTKEHLDAATRRLYGEQYQFFYCDSGDEVDFKVVPVVPEDLPKLPDEAKDTKDFRFYKKPRPEVNETVIKNLEQAIQNFKADTDQLKAQMDGIDGQLVNEDNKIDGYKTAINLLREFIKRKD